jgi:hypothetical protein
VAQPQGILKLAAPLLGRQLKKEFVADFEYLKQLLESQADKGADQ